MVAGRRSLEKACGRPQITRKTGSYILPASFVGEKTGGEKFVAL
jgi:hypothetical protein